MSSLGQVEIDAHPQQTHLRRDHHFSEFVSRLGNFLLCAPFKDHFKVVLYLQRVEEEENKGMNATKGHSFCRQQVHAQLRHLLLHSSTKQRAQSH